MNEGRTDAAAAVLPELTDERIDEIESAVFGRIARQRHSRALSRRRGGLVAASAAAVVVIAVAVGPAIGSAVRIGSAGGGSSTGGSSIIEGAPVAPDSAPVPAERGAGAGADQVAPVQTPDREIVTTASATVRVDDVAEALDAIGGAATASGGYVESMSLDGTAATPVPADAIVPPTVTGGGYITVRVPADDLQATIDSLDEIGQVEASAVSRQDVTTQAIDLRARVDAAQTSVDRLTALLSQAGSVADLIAAESALADRQATLESYQQQLTALDEQVALSAVTVSVLPTATPVAADPAGFGDGLAAGWNGLVATLNGIVIGLGFLLPWLAVAAVAALIVWAVVRLIRRRRRPGTNAAV